MSSDGIKYALIVASRKARDITREGDRFWVVTEPEGWVEATSERYGQDIPLRLMTFPTEAEASAFGDRWEGHPWWCIPKSYQVVQVRTDTKVVFDHYEVVGTPGRPRKTEREG